MICGKDSDDFSSVVVVREVVVSEYIFSNSRGKNSSVVVAVVL